MSGIEATLLILILAACGGSVPPETVESLSASPERLKELRRQDKTERSRLGDERCNRVPEAHPQSAHAQSKARFEQFVEQLGHDLQRERSLVRAVEELHPDTARPDDAATLVQAQERVA